MLQGVLSHSKELRFYSESTEKTVGGFPLVTDILGITFLGLSC